MKDITKENDPLDNYGRLAEPMLVDAPTYDFKKIREFCRMNNKTLADMTQEEIEQFRSN